MDENVSDTPEVQPYPDFTPEPPRRSGLVKILALLLVVAAVGAFFFFGGVRFVKDWYNSQPARSQSGDKMQAWKDRTAFASLALPDNLQRIGAYRAPLKDKGLTVLLVAAEKNPTVLPKDFATALQAGRHRGAVYYLAGVDTGVSSLEANVKAITGLVRQQGTATPAQNKIWIAEKERPASIEDVVKEGQSFQLLTLNVSETAALIAITPKDGVEKAPHRDMIAALLQVNPADVSFVEPEPAGLKLARAVLSSDGAERKKAVPMLVTLGGPQPEAVALLADGFAAAPADVKTDIVAALGLLAPTTPAAVQPLIVALGDKSARLEAMAALGSLGSSANEAVPTLKKIVLNKKEPKGVRAAANTAIAKITGRPLAVPSAKKKKRAR